jgi:ARG/rhodanese/phosphatase superfamily protein
MTPTHAPQSPIDSYLAKPLEVGEPDVSGPLAVFPVFGPDPRLSYVALAEARERGFTVRELQSAASVNDLLVENPTDATVLLYEGEEVLGAQQNRTFDVTVLVAPRAKLRVPVSCVEVGRWDSGRHREDFEVSPQAAYPELRRAKSRQAAHRVAAGLDARADQAEVWHAIDLKSARLGAESPTGAMHDVYESRRDRLNELNGAVHLRPNQVGALVAIDGRFSVLDYVSRVEVFATLHRPLVQGYALDALEATEAEPPSVEDARGFVSLATGTEASERAAIGLGRELRFASDGVAGSGLTHDSELVQLTAFPDDGRPGNGDRGRDPSAHIRRPSRRRI